MIATLQHAGDQAIVFGENLGCSRCPVPGLQVIRDHSHVDPPRTTPVLQDQGERARSKLLGDTLVHDMEPVVPER